LSRVALAAALAFGLFGSACAREGGEAATPHAPPPAAATSGKSADVPAADDAPRVAASPDAPRPLLWSVSDDDNTVYLLGSFHALRASDYPLPAAVDDAFADAERVTFELSPQEMDSPAVAPMMIAAAALPAGQDLRSTVSPDTWAKLEVYAATRGVPLVALSNSEPWFVSLVIAMTEMQRMGLDPQQGLDRHLMTRAADAGKATSGLETAAEQIGALDSMTPTEQQQALDEALGDAEDFQAQMDDLHAKWRRGDDAALERLMGADMREHYPQLYQRINVDRNNAWLPKVRAMLDGEHEDDALVVVGSLHLLGDDGLVALLRKQGYTVERVEAR
jgi:uncharacterized protein YbaP (TraB family)